MTLLIFVTVLVAKIGNSFGKVSKADWLVVISPTSCLTISADAHRSRSLALPGTLHRLRSLRRAHGERHFHDADAPFAGQILNVDVAVISVYRGSSRNAGTVL
jgi:hypothetical protein